MDGAPELQIEPPDQHACRNESIRLSAPNAIRLMLRALTRGKGDDSLETIHLGDDSSNVVGRDGL
jgi:hypothetical protein